jgi:hypothetical protein
MALARAAFGGERSDAFMPSPTPIASRPARVITRLTFFPSSSRQIGIPAFDRISRISLRATRLDPIFPAADLPIPRGLTATPSSRPAAFESTIN